jgi:hypothetical protein
MGADSAPISSQQIGARPMDMKLEVAVLRVSDGEPGIPLRCRQRRPAAQLLIDHVSLVTEFERFT